MPSKPSPRLQTDARPHHGAAKGGVPRPTVSGVASAGATVLLLSVATLFLVIPSVFYLGPIPGDADGVTLCVPAWGPLLRVRDGLSPDQEELAFIHEGAHARQCRQLGAFWYARQVSNLQGRLALEARALCAEAQVLAIRGADPERLVRRAVEALAMDYLGEGRVPRADIVSEVRLACGGLSGA